MYYYNSVTLPFLQLSALAEILEKIDAERKTKNISDDEILGLRLIDDMFTFGKQLRFSIDKSVALAEIFTGKNAPKTSTEHATLDAYKKEISENLTFLKNLSETDFTNPEEKTFSHPIFFPEEKLIGSDIIPFFFANMYFHTTTAYDILRHFGFQIGKKDFLGTQVFAKLQK